MKTPANYVQVIGIMAAAAVLALLVELVLH